MKKITLLSFVLAMSASLFAQDIQKINIGIKVAPAITWFGINNPEVSSDGAKMRFNAGVELQYNFTENYSLVTGVNFNTIGGKLEGDVKTTESVLSTEVSYNFHEIELPIGMKLRTNDFSGFRYFAQFGLGAGFAFSGKATKKDDYKRQSYDNKIMPIRALYNVGIGVEYDLNGTILIGGLNYKGFISNMYFYKDGISKPLNKLDLNPDNPYTYDQSILLRPSAFELVLGVMF